MRNVMRPINNHVISHGAATAVCGCVLHGRMCVCCFDGREGWEDAKQWRQVSTTRRIPCVRSGRPHIRTPRTVGVRGVGGGWVAGTSKASPPQPSALRWAARPLLSPSTSHLVVINTPQSSPVGAARPSANLGKTSCLTAVQVLWYPGRRRMQKAATSLPPSSFPLCGPISP